MSTSAEELLAAAGFAPAAVDRLLAAVDESNADTRTQRSYERGVERKRRETARTERQGKALLSAEDVRTIRRLVADGVPQRELAARYRVSRPTISSAVTRRTWRHV